MGGKLKDSLCVVGGVVSRDILEALDTLKVHGGYSSRSELIGDILSYCVREGIMPWTGRAWNKHENHSTEAEEPVVEARTLGVWEEASGLLIEVEVERGEVTLTLVRPVREHRIRLAEILHEEVLEELRALIGRKVRVLRTDLEERPVRIYLMN
jgi:hypothetical protein